MGLITEAEEENYGLNRMTKKAIVDSCKKNKLYITPNLNDVLYLHFQGYQKIESLEEYTGLKCLWLESNAITEISGLDSQTLLKCLFLHNNLIEKIENLEACKELDTLNLSHNQVSHLLNCGSDILPVLNTLNMGNNYLRTAESIEILRNCHHLSVLDLSNNRLDDILIVRIFADMHDLKVLILTGNPVVNDIPSYRKTLIVECKKLTYLDTRPVFPRDRACAEAWRRGGFQEERQENIRWNKEERREMLRSVNATLRMRNRGGGEPEVQLIPTDSSDDDEYYSREMRPKQCEDISSTEQWNMMDEMMRNPESSDKYQSCKVCGSAFCKYQHIESHAVKDTELSTEEIIESSNFSALWGEDNYKIFNESVTTESVCESFKEEALEKETLAAGASCSYTNSPGGKQFASQNTEETNFSTGNLTTNAAECYVKTATTVISGNEQPKLLQNITELVKVSEFAGDCDSDDDSNASIIDSTDVVFKLADSNKLPGDGKIPQIIAEQCDLDQASIKAIEISSEKMSSDQNTVKKTESPEIVVDATENVIIKDLCQIFEDKNRSSDQSHGDQTKINIARSLELVGHLTENNNIDEVSAVLNKFEGEKIYSDQSLGDEATVNVTENPEMVEHLTENIVVEDVRQIFEDENKYPDQSQGSQTIMKTSEYPEMVESILKIFEDEKKYSDQSLGDEATVNVTENPEMVEYLTENIVVEDEKKYPDLSQGDQTLMNTSEYPEMVESILKIFDDEKKYSVQSLDDEATVNVTESPEMVEHLTENIVVEDEKKYPDLSQGDQTIMNTSEYSEMVESILHIFEDEKKDLDQSHGDEATVNITESPDVSQILEDVKDDIPIENVETNLDTSLECCINVEESICSFKAKSKKGMEFDCALEYDKNFAYIYTKEHENEITTEQTFKSSDLSTLWEENSLAELDGNDSYIESYDNGHAEIVDKFVEKLEKEKGNCIEPISSINVPDATSLYQLKFDDPVKENISNLVQYNNLAGQIGEPFEDVNINHAVIETIENGNSEILVNFECIIPKIEAADEFIEDNLDVPVECNVNTEFENFNYKKNMDKNSQQDNDFLIARIKKNCFELNEMLGSTVELNKAINVAKMQDDDPADQDECLEEFEDIDNSSRIETLGYSAFVTSFEQFFNENELKSAELMKTVDFSVLYTPENDTVSIDNVKVEEKPSCDSINVDEIPAMKNFREYRAHLKTLLHRDSELRESCNELLNEINERLEMIEAIDKPPLADDVSLTELPVNPNNSLISSSNSFYKICYDDPNSSLDFVSIGNDIEGNNAPDPKSNAIEETEDDESSEV